MKGINCQEWEVLAFLTGRKTRITRPVKKGEFYSRIEPSKDYPGKDIFFAYPDKSTTYRESCAISCPYGKIGDTVYIKETWCLFDTSYSSEENYYLYKAGSDEVQARCMKEDGLKYRPSIHMPQEAARIKVMITDIIVKRVQDLIFSERLAECKTDEPYFKYWNSRYKNYSENPLVWCMEVETL